MTTTRINYHIRPPRPKVYRALLDPQAVAAWKVPNEQVVEMDEVETADPTLHGQMTITITRAARRRARIGVVWSRVPGVDATTKSC